MVTLRRAEYQGCEQGGLRPFFPYIAGHSPEKSDWTLFMRSFAPHKGFVKPGASNALEVLNLRATKLGANRISQPNKKKGEA